MEPRKVLQIFREAEKGAAFSVYYFTLGKGKPKQVINRIWFTYSNRILGAFTVRQVVCNVGQLPKLRRIDGSESEWQIKRDRYVVICDTFRRLPGKVYYGSFRGFHYFDFDAYSRSVESKIAI